MDRAVIIGSRTYGKGLVQAIRELPYGGHLKITTSRYYIPSGRCIQAYDYRHLNPDGSVGTVPDSLTKVFHTSGGREVRDGGGIKPDIEVNPDSLATIVYDLVGSDEYQAYAVKYASEHPTIAAAGEFMLTDEEYAQFVDFIQASGFTYNRRSDEVLNLLRDVARREGYLESAQTELDALSAKFSSDLRTDLQRNRKDIEPFLCDEIVKQYYFQRGSVRQMLRDDPCVEKALEVIQTDDMYNQILHGDAK
jgi:carboxyl-terminal processing protease